MSLRRTGLPLAATLGVWLLLAVATVPASAQLAGKEIHIGIGGPLTTSSASFGVEMLQAVELAVGEKNAKGGILGAKIMALAVDDEASNAKGQAVAKAKKGMPGRADVLAALKAGKFQGIAYAKPIEWKANGDNKAAVIFNNVVEGDRFREVATIGE
ncbi:MAG: ABC transporter substrate-binding protein [Alphaproteobacteria bacterium]